VERKGIPPEKDNFDYLIRASMGVSFEDKTNF